MNLSKLGGKSERNCSIVVSKAAPQGHARNYVLTKHYKGMMLIQEAQVFIH